MRKGRRRGREKVIASVVVVAIGEKEKREVSMD